MHYSRLGLPPAAKQNFKKPPKGAPIRTEPLMPVSARSELGLQRLPTTCQMAPKTDEPALVAPTLPQYHLERAHTLGQAKGHLATPGQQPHQTSDFQNILFDG